MTSVDYNFNFLCGHPRPLPPSTCVHLSLTPPPPCGRHKWMAPYAYWSGLKFKQIVPGDTRYQIWSNAPISDFMKRSEIYDLLKFHDFQWKTAMFTHFWKWRIWCFLKVELDSCKEAWIRICCIVQRIITIQDFWASAKFRFFQANFREISIFSGNFMKIFDFSWQSFEKFQHG